VNIRDHEAQNNIVNQTSNEIQVQGAKQNARKAQRQIVNRLLHETQ
jgi:hypothetical protein